VALRPTAPPNWRRLAASAQVCRKNIGVGLMGMWISSETGNARGMVSSFQKNLAKIKTP
jgi:hypothetical protein